MKKTQFDGQYFMFGQEFKFKHTVKRHILRQRKLCRSGYFSNFQ